MRAIDVSATYRFIYDLNAIRLAEFNCGELPFTIVMAV
jgi:hypothetical protein